jgi:2,3-bisphosphoglycerate-dependent phosphoglycerate mutase
MLFLVRHAHSDWSPDESRPLSAAGRLAAESLVARLEPLRVGAIYSSPYTRAIETIQPLAAKLGLPITIDPELRERRLSTEPPADFERWVEASWRDFELAYPGGESNAAAERRIVQAVTGIAAQNVNRNVAIASHGTVLALYLRSLDPRVDFDFWRSMKLPEIYVVERPLGGAWSYRRLGQDVPD